MKRKILFSTGLAVFCALFASAESTIDPAHNDAYGANVGWINASGDTANGAVIGQAFCSGYIYSANCGWISLGDGTPADGQAYSNTSVDDCGVNHDGLGHLTGYAFGANIGWINFEQTQGQPQVDLQTGDMSGSVWSANTGWISLNTIQGYVRTETLDAGPDIDSDGIPDAWEYENCGQLFALTATGDLDDDGVSDVDEYLADTDPADDQEFLRITDFQVAGSTHYVTWPVTPTRRYLLQRAVALSNGMAWVSGSAFIPASGPAVTEEVTGSVDASRFYRVQAGLPLSP